MTRRLLRIVTLASNSGKYGGPFDTACRQAVIAQRSGWSVRILAGTLVGDAPVSTAVPAVFETVRRLLPTPGFTAVGSWRIVRSLWKEIGNSDVIHVSAARELIPMTAMFFGIVRRKTVVAQPHGMLTSRKSRLHRGVDILMKPLVGSASSIIALTEGEAQELREWGGPLLPLSVFGNPLPAGLEPTIRWHPRRQEALFIARLHPRKRVDVFSEAGLIAGASAWPEEYLAFGPDEGDLAALEDVIARSHGAVRYGGTLTAAEVTERVGNSGVFVLPSAKEPWGNVLATALGAGLPVVVAESAALAPLISRFGAGTVVADGDPKELAAAVHRLLSTPVEYHKSSIGAAALARAELSAEQQSMKLNAVYTAVTVRHGE